jgi:hypothetical protein
VILALGGVFLRSKGGFKKTELYLFFAFLLRRLFSGQQKNLPGTILKIYRIQPIDLQ